MVQLSIKNKIIKCDIQANSIKNENIFIDHNLVLGYVFQQLWRRERLFQSYRPSATSPTSLNEMQSHYIRGAILSSLVAEW